jgi:hypothetical protein
MAQVIHEHERKPDIDHTLDRLLAFWRTVPEQAAEWREWDEFSQLDFIVEWPIMRGALWRVSEAAKVGTLDSRQQRKWAELSRLVQMHRAAVEEMLGEPA